MSKVPLVREIMATSLVTLRPEQSIEEAIHLLLKHKVSGATVVNAAGAPVGVLSEKDCLRVLANDAFYKSTGGSVADYMSREITTINPDVELFHAAELFLNNPFRRLPVVEGGRLVGQVSRRDVLLGSLRLFEESPVSKPWTDAKYLSEAVKAALADRPKG